ncbi:transposase [Escherichia coli]|nr:transposase [Escherichia coli]
MGVLTGHTVQKYSIFYLFRTLNEVLEITEKWLSEYSYERTHESLNNKTLEEYRRHHYLTKI